MPWFSWLIVVSLVAAAWVVAQAWSVRRKSLRRLRAYRDESTPSPTTERPGRIGQPRALRRWLALAGYVPDTAAPVFVAATIGGLLAGLAAAWTFSNDTVANWFRTGLVNIPGGLGEAMLSAVAIGPWILIGVLASAPSLIVRASRRERVLRVEEDLPLTLELYATLAEAGLGFDAATSRILDSQSTGRPLARELRTFQRELLGGVPRVHALRGIARRLEVGSVTVFISALAQAEQVGASVTETLRRQADDLRDRRRQRALTLAQSLPVKLVFPLVICFLPGIFLSILGPTIQQLLGVVDGVLRGTR